MVMFGLCSGLLFVLLTLNGFLISIRAPLKMMLLSVRVRPSAIPITSSSSSDRFVYSDERKKLYPDYEKERSYERYLGRLKGSLLSYSVQERRCFEETKGDCLSYNKIESKYATNKYKEEDLHLEVPDHVQVLINGKYCEDTKIVVGIVTAPFQFAERFAIRNSWCKESHHGVKGVRCYFYSGMTSHPSDNAFLQQEASLYNDIVQFDIADTYLNLTILQLQSFNWTMNHCPSMKFYVRTDADMFVNLNTVANRIIPSMPSSFAYGHVFRGAKPFRDPNHKYYLPYSVYSQPFFPPYISGCMCILSRDVLQTIVKGSETVRPIHYLDDAYYGQIMDRYGVLIVDDKKYISVNQLPLNEVLNGNYAAVHRYSPVDLIVIDFFQRGKEL